MKWIVLTLAIISLIGAVILVQSCQTKYTEEASHEVAEKFVKNSPTFAYDGVEGSLKLLETLDPDIEYAWSFVYQFQSLHAGYGDRTGQTLAQVVTLHKAVITIEQGKVKSAIMDNQWDMINQKKL